ncbi:MAG: hypothetical protein SXV54_15065 [Chloroflexota bacterium]|nr:hypothetical protein [Chloroflexota bacterium]
MFSESQAALGAVFNYAPGDAIKEAPVVMFDTQPLAEMAEGVGLEETADAAEFLQAMAENMEAEAGEIETGTIDGYPAALTEISGTQEETSYKGALVIILLEERAIGASAMVSPDQWDDFEPTFIDMLNRLLFFEPQE